MTIMPRVLPTLCGLLLSAISTLPVHADGASLMQVGSPNDRVTGVSGDGETLVGYGSSAFVWTESGGIVPVPGVERFYDLSADGSTAVGFQEADQAGITIPAPVRWTAAGGIEPLGTLGGSSGFALGVSGDGSVVVGRSEDASGATHAFRWTVPDGMQALPDVSVPYPGGIAYGVSSDGTRSVGFVTDESSNTIPVYWDGDGASGPQILPTFPGGPTPPVRDPVDGFRPFGSAYDVSSDGTYIVGTVLSSTDATMFRWSEATGSVEIPNLPGSDVYTARISGDGQTLVGSDGLGTLIWTEETGSLDLKLVLETLGVDTTGWYLETAEDISDDGLTIVGWSVDSFLVGANVGSWRVTLPADWTTQVLPEPGTGVLLSLGLALLVLPRRATTSR